MATPPLFSQDLASPALAAYETLAAFYDDFTAGYAHDVWLGEIQALAAWNGVTAGRALDVACGTGKSSQPLLETGWEVWACDLSPAMVRAAQARLGLDSRHCFVADMCELPLLDPFDLVLCLDDSINYLTEDGQLEWAMAAFASVLAPGGLLVFDLNTLRTYGTVFASEFSRTGQLGEYVWHGLGDGAALPDQRFAAEVEVRQAGRNTSWGQHLQRHYSRQTVERAATSAGLSLVGCYGQSVGAQLHPYADEALHSKAVYLLCPANRKGVPHDRQPVTLPAGAGCSCTPPTVASPGRSRVRRRP